ncbi:MAG: hypothetical protein JJU36_10225 [Phycisphaeraceae bacterium]|nr:hypothetical protein [Phycisphaeraceae bacterium]
MQRLLLDENVRAAGAYYRKYWNESGHLICIPRWGWADGTDDVLQGVANFPLVYALGGDRGILDLYYQALEGFLDQFSSAEVEYAPAYGALYRESMTANDWHHHSEYLTAFNQLAVADPHNAHYRSRARRFAGFYLNEGLPDGAEPIYDPERRLIRSLITGSRGAQLEIEPRFWGHRWEEWQDRTRVKGDAPLNLYATTQPALAFALTGEERYRQWVVDYVEAWIERARMNGYIFPANVGLSGEIGEHWGGRWWPNALGAWSRRGKAGSDGLGLFLPAVTAGLQNAMILSGDVSHFDALRRQIHVLLENAIEHDDGKRYPPAAYEDDGWDGRMRFGRHLVRLYLSSFREDDLKLIADERKLWGRADRFSYYTGFFYHGDDFAWLHYVLGENPEYPDRVMRSDLDRIRARIRAMRQDDSIPHERLTDHTFAFNPLATHGLFTMITGGPGPYLGKATYMLWSEVWPYDPEAGRPGLPPEVAMNVERITADGIELSVVNLNQTESRVLVIQMGAYGESRCVFVRRGRETIDVDSHYFVVDLAPGSGGKLMLAIDRRAYAPRAGLPWLRQPIPHAASSSSSATSP